MCHACLQDVLDLVRGQDRDSFTCLLINWYRRAKGKYKVPTFAHQELDLHKVFWEVQDKGGYDQVTNFKLWKVCTPNLAAPALPCAADMQCSMHYCTVSIHMMSNVHNITITIAMLQVYMS